MERQLIDSLLARCNSPVDRFRGSEIEHIRQVIAHDGSEEARRLRPVLRYLLEAQQGGHHLVINDSRRAFRAWQQWVKERNSLDAHVERVADAISDVVAYVAREEQRRMTTTGGGNDALGGGVARRLAN